MTYKSMTLDVISADAPSMCMTYKSMTLDVISADAPSLCMTYRNMMSTAGESDKLLLVPWPPFPEEPAACCIVSFFFLVLSYVLLIYADPGPSHEKLKS